MLDGLGDDALNIHSMAGTATSVDLESRTIKCNYSKKSPDLNYWYEVGTVDGMYIHRNEFIGNGFVRPTPIIATHTSHKGTDEGICGLHKR